MGKILGLKTFLTPLQTEGKLFVPPHKSRNFSDPLPPPPPPQCGLKNQRQ